MASRIHFARNELSMADGWTIVVRGLVQGVGFRPTVWQIAHSIGLKGNVRNTSKGVAIELLCSLDMRDRFVAALKSGLPALARIDSIECLPLAFAVEPDDFVILASQTSGPVSASIVADAMICEACASEIRDPENRRHGHAFANCTQCGPRLTVVHRIPYDRSNTAMSGFAMCDLCRADYENPANRRFHAEPIACPHCGPQLWLEAAPCISSHSGDAIQTAGDLLLAGHIVAIKGLGGFHLACRADDPHPIARLRLAKSRSEKPLAVMARDLNAIRMFAECSDSEAQLLASRSGPIVLLRKHRDNGIAPMVAPGQNRIGVMLPTTPLHALLMDHVDLPLIMTSANAGGEPQCTTNEDARLLLGTAADAVLLHDRDIVTRVDDSVVRLDSIGPTMIRRARGHAPEPFRMPTALLNDTCVFAAGADIKSSIAFATNGEVTVSQHLGDLDEPKVREAYHQAVHLYASMFERRPDVVAVDKHPNFVSSRIGEMFALETGARLVTVQHHHAHLAACMAENGLGNNPVLGVVLDGTGFGDYGTIWGGEFLVGNYSTFRRVAHFLPVPLIGGDRASLEPWRNGFAHLNAAFGGDFMEGEWADLPSVRKLAQRPLAPVRTVMASRKFSPLASSAGRLFDAAAYLIGIAPDQISYEGQAGMELEALAEPCMNEARSYACAQTGTVLEWRSLWTGLLDALKHGRDPALLAADFHLTLIEVLEAKATALCREGNLETVALTGGVFQNGLLLEGLGSRLAAGGLRVLVHHQFPANDGSIALGQAAVAICQDAR